MVAALEAAALAAALAAGTAAVTTVAADAIAGLVAGTAADGSVAAVDGAAGVGDDNTDCAAWLSPTMMVLIDAGMGDTSGNAGVSEAVRSADASPGWSLAYPTLRDVFFFLRASGAAAGAGTEADVGISC